MKMSEAFPSKYLKAADLDGEKRVLQIAEVKRELVGQGEEQEYKPVVYFEDEDKGLILNATNGRSISGMYGDESDDWTGCFVTLYPAWVDAFGKQTEAIRIEPRPPAQTKRPSKPEPDDVPF